MKKLKQLLSLMLILAMFLSLGMPAYAAAAETAAEESGYGAAWDDWDDAPAGDPAELPVFEEQEVPEVPEVPEEPEIPEIPGEEEIPAFGEEPEAAAYPANEFYYVGGSGLRVTVKAPEGAFPADAYMSVEETKLKDAQEKIDASDVVDGVAFLAADISFANAGGRLQPQQPVEVRITSPSAEQAGEPVIVHVNDAGELEIVGELAEFAGPGASVLTVESAADACTYCFEAKSFSEYIAVDQDPQSVFLHSVSDEPMFEGSAGEITLTGEWPTGASYVMADAEQKSFYLSFEKEGLQDVVLVVEGLKYGAEYAVIPGTDDDVTEVLQLDNHTVALRLANTDAKIELDASFTMRHIELSDEYAAELIDGGMQNTRIACTEYSWSGPLSEVLTREPVGATVVLWEGKPACDMSDTVTVATATVPSGFGSYSGQEYAQGYKYSVSTQTRQGVSLSNLMLGNAGRYTYQGYFGPYSNGAIRVNLPAAYSDGGALMEITAIRVYEPTDLVRLVPGSINAAQSNYGYGLGGDALLGQTFYWGRYGNPFLYNAVYNHPKNWVAGERTLDPETGKYYYEVTPPAGTRWFNTESLGLDACTGVLPLGWVLADPDRGLTPDTVYKGQDTVFFVKLPGDSAARKVSITGPEIHTWKLEERSIGHTFNPIRALSHRNEHLNWPSGWYSVSSQYLSDENVVVGSIVRDEWFSQVYNSNYVKRDINTEYKPEYTGPVTQRYDFPYQIQPTKIYLRESSQRTLNLLSEKSTLTAIRWETWDGQSGAADAATVAAVNAAIRTESVNGQSGQPQGFYRDGSNLLLEYAFPAGIEIRRVVVEWARLSTEKGAGHDYQGDTCTMQTNFDYRVNDRSGYGQSGSLPEYTRVHAVYTESYDGVYNGGAAWSPAEVQNVHYAADDTRNGPQSGQRYLWFRLKNPVDPDLYGKGLKGEDLRYQHEMYFLGDKLTDDIGHVGFEVGSYGQRRDFIHDPEIELWLESGWWHSGLNGITKAQSVSLLTGAFTATKEASGWTFYYTTKNHGAELQDWTVPTLTEDTPVQIPLDAGDCFTSLKLCYEGEADLSHENEDDLRTVIWLMKDVQVLMTDVNPVTGGRITTTADYDFADLQLHGRVTYDVTEVSEHDPATGALTVPHCGCLHSSGEDTHVLGQEMKHPMNGTRMNAGANGAYVYSTRKATLGINLHEPEGENIYQGGSTFAAWQFYGSPSAYTANGLFYDQVGLPDIEYPWEALGETFYIELPDPEFVFDPDRSKIFGYGLDEPGVEWGTVTGTDGKTYLKIGFSKSFQRRLACWDGGWASAWGSTWDNYSYSPDLDHVGWTYNPNYYTARNGRAQPYGALELAFTSLPGTLLGEHHPIGAIYFDASGMLENYCASINQPAGELTGYDYDRTKYEFTGTNVVPDPAGLSATGVTGPKLFYYDGSGYTVNVDISVQAGADLAPGKNSVYNFDPRVTVYRPTEENSLNALLTLKGSGNPSAGSIFDMESYVALPRIGTSILWSEVDEQTGVQTVFHSQENTELELFLRGAVTPISNPSALAMTITYTTDAIPAAYGAAANAEAAAAALAGLHYVDAGQITDWSAVTGFRVCVPEMTVKSAINLRVDLRSNPKQTVDVLSAFSGGAFRYKINQGGSYSNNGLLQLCEWRYDNILLSCGRVFWDSFDENGLRNGNNNTEPFINGVTVSLYDAGGQLIDQQITANSAGGTNANNDGVFPALRSYKIDAGQYIVIDDPTVSDGSTVKLTKRSVNSPLQSGLDSDFDRDTNTLTLGALSINGLNNISAGFVKLPKLVQLPDQTLPVGASVDLDAIVNEYVSNTNYSSNILTNGGYTIAYAVAHESIAALAAESSPLQRVGSSTAQIKGALTVIGVAPGVTAVTVTVSNTLGDTDSISFNVTVVPNVFYIYHSSDGTLEAVDMPTENGAVNLVSKVRGAHRYGGYYSACAAVTGENVEAAKDPALSAGTTGAPVSGAELYTGEDLKNSDGERFWIKADAARAATDDPGNALHPTVGEVYYLKEVPEAYLCSRISYVYDWAQDYKLIYFYLLTAIDDGNYSAVQFNVQTSNTNYPATIVSSFAITQRNSTTKFINRATDFTGLRRGYIGYADATDLLTALSEGDSFTMTPQWITLDGVPISGTARSFRFDHFTKTGIVDPNA